MPATRVDPRKQNDADARAAKRRSRQAAAEHNARVERERAALAAHVARWGEDGFECA